MLLRSLQGGVDRAAEVGEPVWGEEVAEHVGQDLLFDHVLADEPAIGAYFGAAIKVHGTAVVPNAVAVKLDAVPSAAFGADEQAGSPAAGRAGVNLLGVRLVREGRIPYAGGAVRGQRRPPKRCGRSG